MSMKSTRHRARIVFLQAIKKHAPKALNTLKNEVLPLFKKLTIHDSDVGEYIGFALTPTKLELKARSRIKTDWSTELSDVEQKYHSVIRVEQAICDWANTLNLIDGWCLNEALQTLTLWREKGIASDDWAYSPEFQSNEDSKRMFLYPVWYFEADSWLSYERKITERFTRELRTYKERVEEAAKENGVPIIETKRKEKSSQHHFTWLVEFQVKSLEFAEIVYANRSTTTLSSSTIKSAVHSTAALIGLTLRKAKRGPRPKR